MTTWVLLRGLAREARHWGGFPDKLRCALPAGDTVVALDLPGNGALWRERSPARVEDMVAAARRTLAGVPHTPPYALVALSLGGMVALQWALEHREEVRGCVLINSSLGRFSPFWRRLRPASYATLLRLLAPGRAAIDRERAILRLTSNLPLAEGTQQAWTAYALEAPVSRGNALRQLKAAALFRAPAAAPGVPLLLVASERDRLVSVECSRAMARHWGAPLRVHPAAGHDLALDDPGWLAGLVADWKTRVS
ncbi:alpha/beta hydrolase [Caenimonas sedimenti]|uniref:Alpha/beta hydrolase n=1 Tax=Caenimonas sedimenti TaxID=2596921 RepID=A0A562ZTD8_9BURK|nr:alpha/beta hydrolase [Caenimonas sedimenti]TWO71626.1 alpha/beta hydrolase [Caenimonas sedimenti]